MPQLPLHFSFSFLLLLMPKCPTCGKAVERQGDPWRPFCSERCQLIDFGRWADEEYRVPGRQITPADTGLGKEDDDKDQTE
jgi:uncharacterized protein